MAESSERDLTPDEAGYVAAARDKAFVLYEGARTPHRSCGIAICDSLVRPHGEFAGPARKAFCTNLAADVAALTAEALCRFAPARPAITPVETGGAA